MALTDKLKAIADAIRAKTGKSAKMTLAEMPTEIASISGLDTSDATATDDTVLSPETYYANGEKHTGTMPNIGRIDTFINWVNKDTGYTIPKGYHNGGGTVQINYADRMLLNDPNNIAENVTILGTTGTYKGVEPTYDTPTITVSSGGLITASANGKSNTEQLTTQAAKSVTPSESSQTAVASGRYTTGNVTVNAISSTYVGSGVTKQAAKTVTPTKSEQTAVASGVYTTGAVKVAAIPSDYIIPSGSETKTANGTYDVTSLAQLVVAVSGGGGGLPSGVSAFAYGNFTVASDFTTTRNTYNHSLGVTPDLMIVYAPANVATTYSMLAAIRGNMFGWRSSSYNGHMAYHGNSTTSVTWTNSNSSSYGISNMAATTFQLASASSSYYWRKGTYKYMAFKFS